MKKSQAQALKDIILSDNKVPLDAFEGYSSKELMEILKSPFAPNTVLTLNSLPPEDFSEVPIVQLVLFLLRTIKESGKVIELAEEDTLPEEIVRALSNHPFAKCISLGTDSPEPIKQDESYATTATYSACLAAELITINDGLGILTEKGEKALTDYNMLYHSMIDAISDFDFWYYFQDIEDEASFKKLAYMIMLLHKYGRTEREARFFITRFWKSVGQLLRLDDDVSPKDAFASYVFRMFQIALPLLGITNITKDENGFPITISTNEFFRKVFSCNPPKNIHKLKTDFSGIGLRPS